MLCDESLVERLDSSTEFGPMAHDNLKLSSWKEFKNYVERLEKEIAVLREAKFGGHQSQPIFRGQADASWRLSTTLERIGSEHKDVDSYLRIMESTRRYLGNFVPDQWSGPSPTGATFESLLEGFPRYEFAAYLRHHGFPSPLLDWSQSPYVAAFFAFAPRDPRENVAIYVLREYAGHGKVYSSHEPHIEIAGPWVAVHRRHVMQQCLYSYCFQMTENTLEFAPHENVWRSDGSEMRHDLLTKVVLPFSERDAALQDLHRMNVMPHSLFASDDALVATATLRIFDRLGQI